MSKKPMKIATPLFPGVVCATCLKEHPNLQVIPDLPGEPSFCPTCYDKIIPPIVKKKVEVTDDSNYTIESLFS